MNRILRQSLSDKNDGFLSGFSFQKSPIPRQQNGENNTKGALKMNKKQTGIYEQWLKSNNLNLYDCYKKPSESKLDAEWCIIQSCRKMNGERFRILSYNTFIFTCAFSIKKDGKRYLIWHSPYNTECFEIPA